VGVVVLFLFFFLVSLSNFVVIDIVTVNGRFSEFLEE